MKKQRTKEEKKQLAKNIIKYTLGAIGLGVFCYAGYKYVTSDTPRPSSPELDKLVDDVAEQWNKDKEEEYSKGYSIGYNESILDMVNWCKEHGKSIVATTSSKGHGEENAENWLIAEVVTEKPNLDDALVDYPYCIKTPKDK